MSDRVVRIVIDPSAAEQGEAKVRAAFSRIKNDAKFLQTSLKAIGGGDGLERVNSGAAGAATATEKLTRASAASASASRTRKSALETEAQAQDRISKMVAASVDRYEAERKAALASAQAKRDAARSGGDAVPGRATVANQNKMMGLSTGGKIAADVLNGTKDVGKAASELKKVEDGAKRVGTALHGSVGAFREVIVLAREAGRGDFTRMAGSASILFQQLGGIQAVGVPLLATLGGIGAVVGIVSAALLKGSQEANRFGNQLRLTGNYAGLTRSSYEEMAEAIGKSTNTSIGSNEELISSLAKANAFTKDEIAQLTQSAQLLGRATGEEATSIVEDFTKMADGPAKYAQAYAEKYGGVISPTQVAHIKLLEETGQKSQALKALIQDVNDGIARNTEQNTGIIVRGWNNVIRAISDAWTRLKQFGAADTPAQKVARIQGQIDGARASNYGLQSQLPRLQQELAAAKAEQAAAERKAATQARQARITQEGNAAARELSTTYSSLVDSQTRYNNAAVALRRNVAAALRANPNNQDALNLQRNMPAALAKLRKQYMPETVKTETKAANQAESEARRAAREEAQRQERAEEFLKTLDAQAKAAAETPIQAAITAKTQQLENILGRKLADSAVDRARAERIVNDVIADRQAKLQQELRKANDATQSELDNRTKALGTTERQQAIDEAGRAAQLKAIEAVGDKQTDLIAKEVERAKVLAGQTYDLEQQARLMGNMGQLSAKASQLDRLRDLSDQRAALDGLNKADASGTSALQRKYGADASRVYNEASKGLSDAVVEAKDQFKTLFGQAIYDLADQLDGQLGSAVGKMGRVLEGVLSSSAGDYTKSGPLGALASVLKWKADGTQSGFSTGFQGSSQRMRDDIFGGNGRVSAIANPLKSLSGNFGEFKDSVRSIFGKGGNISKGLGEIAGKAGAGMEIGGAVDSLMKGIGLKTSKMGSQIGGAIGGAVGGPLGAAIGSATLGLLGGLLKKAPKGGTSIAFDAAGQATAGTTFGNNTAAKAASVQGAGSVAQGLNSIMSSLGASISGVGKIVIGQYNGKWRVQTDGSDHLGGKNHGAADAVDFGKDGQAAAVQYALQAALKQGVLTGISDFSAKLLRNAKDIDSAVSLASEWEGKLKTLAQYDDPVKAAFDTINKEFQTLSTQLKANGASASDLASAERLYEYQRKDALKSQLADLQSLKDKLNGDGSGLTASARYAAALTKFRGYTGDIDAGKTVNQSDFASAASALFDVSKELNGSSTSAFQDDRALISAYNDKFMTNVTSVFGLASNSNNDVTDALKQQNAMVDAGNVIAQQQLQVSNRILAALTTTSATGRLSNQYVNGVAA